jgi:hypothetical protein
MVLQNCQIVQVLNNLHNKAFKTSVCKLKDLAESLNADWFIVIYPPEISLSRFITTTDLA